MQIRLRRAGSNVTKGAGNDRFRQERQNLSSAGDAMGFSGAAIECGSGRDKT